MTVYTKRTLPALTVINGKLPNDVEIKCSDPVSGGEILSPDKGYDTEILATDAKTIRFVLKDPHNPHGWAVGDVIKVKIAADQRKIAAEKARWTFNNEPLGGWFDL